MVQLDKHVGVHFIGICVYEWEKKKNEKSPGSVKANERSSTS